MPGQIVYPDFNADVPWKFRWYSILNQLLTWTVIALVFGAAGADGPPQAEPDRKPVGATP